MNNDNKSIVKLQHHTHRRSLSYSDTLCHRPWGLNRRHRPSECPVATNRRNEMFKDKKAACIFVSFSSTPKRKQKRKTRNKRQRVITLVEHGDQYRQAAEKPTTGETSAPASVRTGRQLEDERQECEMEVAAEGRGCDCNHTELVPQRVQSLLCSSCKVRSHIERGTRAQNIKFTNSPCTEMRSIRKDEDVASQNLH